MRNKRSRNCLYPFCSEGLPWITTMKQTSVKHTEPQFQADWGFSTVVRAANRWKHWHLFHLDCNYSRKPTFPPWTICSAEYFIKWSVFFPLLNPLFSLNLSDLLQLLIFPAFSWNNLLGGRGDLNMLLLWTAEKLDTRAVIYFLPLKHLVSVCYIIMNLTVVHIFNLPWWWLKTKTDICHETLVSWVIYFQVWLMELIGAPICQSTLAIF